MASPLQLRAPLVGRDRELDELLRVLGIGGTDPQRRAVLVAGDAGVGKTRLLAELAERADSAGWRRLVGHCLDFGDSAPPYLAFSELFGELTRADPDLVHALVEQHPALDRLHPGRRRLSAGGATHETATRAGAPLDGVGQGDLVDAVHGALDAVAESGPVLVVIEDVHWADRSTRDLLTLLFTRPFRNTVELVVSYRTDDLHRRHPLRSSVAEWVRLPGVHRLQLAPLPDDDIRRLLQSLHADLTAQDVHGIVARAGGNAFFAEELLAAELGDGTLPDDLADLLLVRLDRLQDPARDVVRAAAVAGPTVSHAQLVAVVDLPADVLDRAIRDAVEKHVLVGVAPQSPTGDDGGYAFRHALLAEAVYDDLLPGERVRLHAAYTAALRDGRAPGTAADLARHARAAHDLDTALRASIEAGDDALAVGGPGEAAGHYSTALELLADPTRPAPSDIDAVALVERASDAIVGAGRPEKARSLVHEHLRQLPAGAATLTRARLLVAYAAATLMSEHEGEALEATTEAMALVPDEPSTLRAGLLATHASALTEHGRYEEASRVATEAVGMGQQLDLPGLVSDASTTLARIEEWTGSPDAARTALMDVITRARAIDDPESEMRGSYQLGQLHHEAAELEEAEQLFVQAAGVATASGRPWSPYGFSARLFVAITRYERGDWDGALAASDPLAPDGTPGPAVASALFVGVRMAVGAGRGDTAAIALLDQVRPQWEKDGLVGILSAAALIDLYGDSGRVDDAVRVHDEVVGVVGRVWAPHFQARARLSGLLLGQLASAAGSAHGADRARLADLGPPLTEAVEAVQQRMSERRRPFGPEGLAWVARAQAEGLRLRWLADVDPPGLDHLVSAWERTVPAFEEMGHTFEVARSQARLAAVLTAAGDPAAARPLLEAARSTATRLRAAPLSAELDRVAPSGARRAPSDPDHRPSTLTPREAEILALVAEGRSNGEIGRTLFISTKTVSVHVSNILAKLGAGSRTEAVAVARRAGLL